MARLGRPKMPTTIALLRDSRWANPNEPAGEPASGEAPAWLDEYAREFWTDHVPEMLRLGYFRKLDVPLFVAVCVEWSVFRRASARAGKGLTQRTKAHGRTARPELMIGRQALAMLTAILPLYGFSPSARAKLTAPVEEKTPSKWADAL